MEYLVLGSSLHVRDSCPFLNLAVLYYVMFCGRWVLRRGKLPVLTEELHEKGSAVSSLTNTGATNTGGGSWWNLSEWLCACSSACSHGCPL
jgi:hypothetical protein